MSVNPFLSARLKKAGMLLVWATYWPWTAGAEIPSHITLMVGGELESIMRDSSASGKFRAALRESDNVGWTPGRRSRCRMLPNRFAARLLITAVLRGVCR